MGLLALGLPLTALAHVGYVVGEAEGRAKMGFDFEPYRLLLTDPFYVTLAAVLALLAVLLVKLADRSLTWKRLYRRIEERCHDYHPFVPWMVRLGLGIALIGAATSGTLISPSLPHEPSFAFVQLLLGFLFIVGLFLPLAGIGAALLYVVALFENTYLLGNLDFLALAFASLMLADGRPGVDDLLLLPQLKLGHLKADVHKVLRWGIGIGMGYLAIFEKLLNPRWSELVVHQYRLTDLLPVRPEAWVLGAGAVELLVAVMLFFGYRTRLAAAVAIVMLSLTFFCFREAVYAHVTLFTTLAALFVYGDGKRSS